MTPNRGCPPPWPRLRGGRATPDRETNVKPVRHPNRARKKPERPEPRQTSGAPLAALLGASAGGLAIRGDLSALDNLDVRELARLARRAGR